GGRGWRGGDPVKDRDGVAAGRRGRRRDGRRRRVRRSAAAAARACRRRSRRRQDPPPGDPASARQRVRRAMYKLFGQPGWGSVLVEAQLAWYGLPYEIEDVGDLFASAAARAPPPPLHPPAPGPTPVLPGRATP